MNILICTGHWIVVLSVLLLAQGLNARTEYVQLLKYAQNNGLSSYNIRRIIKDKNGFIWIGTQDGLNRFDGKTFVNYTKNAPVRHRICGVDIREIIEDTANNLIWVLPGEYGLNAISTTTGNVVDIVPVPYQDPGEWRISMTTSGRSIWIGTSVGIKVYNKAERRFEPLPELPGIGSHHASAYETRKLFTDEFQNVWAFYSGYGVVIYSGKNNSILRTIPLSALDAGNFGNIRFSSIAVPRSGEILLGTNHGLRKIHYDQSYETRVENRPCDAIPWLNDQAVEAIGITREGMLYVASHSQLFRLNRAMSLVTQVDEQATDPQGYWMDAVQYIFCDNDDGIWLGCQQGLGFMSSVLSPFRRFYYDADNNSKLDHVRSICPVSDSICIVGLRNGIATVNLLSGRIRVTDTRHLFHHVFAVPNGQIIAARQDGLFVYRKRKLLPIHQVYPEFARLGNDPVNSHFFSGDSVVVMGTENNHGLIVWNQQLKRVIRLGYPSFPGLLATNIVNNIFHDRRGRVWVLSDNCISILSSDRSVALRNWTGADPVSGQPLNLFFDMCESGGKYWIASYGNGILQLDSQYMLEKIFNTGSGLSNDGVYQIFPVNGMLVITSNFGLSVLHPESGEIKNYYRSDGLHSNAFEEVAGTFSRGKIYAGGVQGFTIIDPSKFATDTKPPVIYINRIYVDRPDKTKVIDTASLELQCLEIPSDVLQTKLYFSGINYSNPERTTFAYRIRENDTAWVDIGTDNSVTLIGLAPDTYHLEVKAANEDGYWSSPATITLLYLPKWYQTWWFKMLLGLAVAGGGYGLYRMRISQILRQQKIRREVASDLHDDIGSSLNSVKVFAHLASADPAKPEYIRNIEQNLEQATIGLRDMIWILDDKRDSIDDLCQRLGQLSARPAEAIGIQVVFEIGEGLRHRVLSKNAKRNLFLIAKEAINNSVKYSQCRRIRIAFALELRKLKLTIADDGAGFDTAATQFGYGLENMRLRAEQINFRFRIESGPAGTNLMFTEK